MKLLEEQERRKLEEKRRKKLAFWERNGYTSLNVPLESSSESESEEEGTGPVAMETIASELIACTTTYTYLKSLLPNTVTSSPLVRDDVSENVLTIGMVGKWADCLVVCCEYT